MPALLQNIIFFCETNESEVRFFMANLCTSATLLVNNCELAMSLCNLINFNFFFNY